MFDDTRWAARLQFLEELWRSRSRIIVDDGVVAALRERARTATSRHARSSASGASDALDALLDQLVASRPGRVSVWVAVTDPADAEELAHHCSGVEFVTFAQLADVVRRERWDVALIDVGAVLDEGRSRLDEGLNPGLAAVVRELAVAATAERSVVMSARARRESPTAASGEALAEFVAQHFGDARLYGLFAPHIISVVEFGDDDASAADLGEDAGDEDLVYDNTLASEDPDFAEFMCVVGEPVAGNVTLLELPGVLAHDRSRDSGGLRVQLVEALRQIDLAAIERQALIERHDALAADRAGLLEQVEALQARVAEVVMNGSERPDADASAVRRPDTALAREQALRWRIAALEGELSALRERPVSVLEAEVASLRARLDACGTNGEGPTTDPRGGREHVVATRVSPIPQHLERLAHRLERESMSAVVLRRELLRLSRRLRA